MKKDLHKTRRQFLQSGLKAGAALSLLGGTTVATASHLPEWTRLEAEKPHHPLNILILGGTSFLGPHQIAYAMSRGHKISTFTRGKTKPVIHKKLFKEVEELIGDRNNNLEALRGRKWDAVIDNSGHRVAWTRDSARLLSENVDLYLYTSSTGVYYPYLGSDIKESTKPVLKVPDGVEGEQKIEYDYGVMKANSEIEAMAAFGADRTIVVRPTYMIGPADRSDRFTYWPVRLSMGGEVFVPGKVDDPVQYIDVRDVAGWMIRLIEGRKAGTYNAVGPASATGMMQFVYGAHAAFSSPANFVNVDDYEFLIEHKVPYVIPWIMPVGDNFGSARANNQYAIENGLTFTPLAKSVHDIYEYWQSDAVSDERRQKMLGPDSLIGREKDILAAWKNR